MNYLKIHVICLIIVSLIHLSQSCFEYSCEECSSEEYGKCTKCSKTFKLVDGTCPCSDPGCAICTSGFSGLGLCIQCKNGYIYNNGNCDCPIDFCERCSKDGCLKCYSGYFYNSITKKCEKNETRMNVMMQIVIFVFLKKKEVVKYVKKDILRKKENVLNYWNPALTKIVPMDIIRRIKMIIYAMKNVMALNAI